MIPCKINKCIIYPTCIKKERIHCRHLHDYFQHASGYEWNQIRNYFPNIKYIDSEDRRSEQ